MKFQIKVGDLLAAVNDVSFTIDKKSTEGSGGILVRAFKTETEAAVLLYTTMHKAETVIKHSSHGRIAWSSPTRSRPSFVPACCTATRMTLPTSRASRRRISRPRSR